VAEFVATDTIAPVSPDKFGVTLVREEWNKSIYWRKQGIALTSYPLIVW
jgi:hypothetical protein